jgi:hypothetical protein
MLSNVSNHSSTSNTLSSRGIRFFERGAANKNEDNSFTEEWNLFATECGLPMNANTAWRAFSRVMTVDHADENEFSKQLFCALFEVLGGDMSNLDPDRLRMFSIKRSGRRAVGFARDGVRREGHLGFPSCYDAAENSVCDHACFFRHSKDARDFECYDVTASVELKMSDTNCKPFVVNSMNEISRTPKLKSDHGALGQALLYALDTLHCLARRGVLSLSHRDKAPHDIVLPVVVLAGKRTSNENANRLCCVDATLNIPEYVGGLVTYKVESHITFQEVDFEKKAIACYLRALRKGLKNANAIYDQYRATPSLLLPPDSMCGAKLRIGTYEVPGPVLVASPIPYANATTNPALRARIAQGELFSFTAADSTWLRQARQSFVVFGDPTNDQERLLLKVSCAAVHNSLVAKHCCWSALRNIRDGPAALQSKIAEVLLLCWRPADGHTLVTVMKDRRNTHTHLYPSQFMVEMARLWAGFSTLVKDLLLPLARVGVIHADIRVGWSKTHNILYPKNDRKGGLLLIDYDSLIEGVWAVDVEENGSAVIMKILTHNLGPQSSVQYVLWQILWMAYVWALQNDEDDLVFRDFFDAYVHGSWDKTLKALFALDQDFLSTCLSHDDPTDKDVYKFLKILSQAF